MNVYIQSWKRTRWVTDNDHGTGSAITHMTIRWFRNHNGEIFITAFI